MRATDAGGAAGGSALRLAGVGLALVGASVAGTSGWFTLTSAQAASSSQVNTTVSGAVSSYAESTAGPRVNHGRGPAHTRTGAS